MASTTTKISTKKFHFPTELRRGGGGPDPFVVKDYKKGLFFIKPFPKLIFFEVKSNSQCWKQTLDRSCKRQREWQIAGLSANSSANFPPSVAHHCPWLPSSHSLIGKHYPMSASSTPPPHPTHPHFYRTQVYLGSDLWVQVSLTNSNTFCRLNWCDSGWWRYQFNSSWWYQ